MFWRKKRTAGPPQVGCFGKLPATGDFIRLNAAGEELAAFDRWMGGGIDFARRFMTTTFEPAYQGSVGLFIFRADADKDNEPPARAIVGAWAPSGDNAGRLYPMTVFASYDYGQLCSAGGGVPIALFPFLSAAYELVLNGRNLPVDGFLDRVARLQLPSLEDPNLVTAGYKSWLASQPMKALWDTGFGTDANRYWVVQNILASVQPFRGQEMPKTGLAVRLPLGPGDAYAAAVWLDVTMRLAKWKSTLLNAFWAPQQALLIHLGTPHVASFRELISPTGQADHVADLCGPATLDEMTTRRALGPQLDGLVARTDLSLAQFLEGILSV